jgi:hypothetical protein
MRTTIYPNSGDFAKQFKITDPAKAVATWLKSLLGSTHEGQQVKEVAYFQIIRNVIRLARICTG